MNRFDGGRPGIDQSPLKTPNNSPLRPRFVSYDRLPPAQPHRRTRSEFFEDICYYIACVCLGVFIIEVVVQTVLYGYLQTPGSRLLITGQTLTHYEVLNTDHRADQEEITIAWRGLSGKFHPDTVPGGNTQESREKYYWIQLAYVELSDPLARCYHDQYHGFIPIDFGGDDPCTNVLIERERDARQPTNISEISGSHLWNQTLRRAERLSGTSFNWLRSTKDETLKWTKNKAGEWEERTHYWEQFGEFVKRIATWPFIPIGFFLTVTELFLEYIFKLGEKYRLRRRVVQFFEGLRIVKTRSGNRVPVNSFDTVQNRAGN